MRDVPHAANDWGLAPETLVYYVQLLLWLHLAMRAKPLGISSEQTEEEGEEGSTAD